MLEKYLTESPTITEKLAFSSTLKRNIEAVEDRVMKARGFVVEWQSSWDKKA